MDNRPTSFGGQDCNILHLQYCWVLPGLDNVPFLGVLDPFGPAARSDPPCFTSGPPGASCIPLPSGPSGVSLDPPVCPPVPLVSLGSYSSIVIAQL